MTDRATDNAPGAAPCAETAAADPSVPRLELAPWATRYGLVAGITTRERGFNLGLWSEEASGQVMGRWRAFHATFAPRFPAVVLAHQAHGAEVRWYDGPRAGWLVLEGIDGHATTEPGVLLTVTVADCIPVYLAAPRHGVVALLHAGWRGVAAGILERGLAALQRTAGLSPANIVMHCGVGICGSCYEVGSEVVTGLTGAEAGGASRVDLRGVLTARARRLGVEEITRSSYCTAHDHERFYSHRASGGRDGRMVAYLGRPQPGVMGSA